MNLAESEISFAIFQLFITKDSGYSTDIVEDPCSNEGYNWTRTSEFLWNVPCVKGDYAKDMFGK